METGNRKKSNAAPSTKAGSKAAPTIDWAGAKKAYCGSHQSTREIGRAFGVSHTMVAKRASAEGWERPAKPEKAKPAPKGRARTARPPAGAPAAPVVAEGLDARQQRFVDEYLVDLNGTQAYIRAVPGTPTRTAETMAARWLGRVEVQAAVQAGRAAMQDRTQVTADKLLLQAAQIAFADPRELIETKVGCCRHCWGTNFLRQRTQFQRDADFEQWRKKAKEGEVFDEEGGTGFNPHLPPNPECIECCGDGHSRDVIKDTRYLSPAAAQLYAGVKRTRHGIEVLMHDKATFAEKLWRHLGLFEKDNGQRNDPLALRTMSDTERAVRLSAVLQGSPELLAMFAQLTGGGAQE
ncbi:MULTISPECIES: terminase small subunit [unclassified Acidovorax]|uniref:terminase small subunit n=1 Tax=unclassified Acidovorax TaxID=2684926 RepID=UPI001C480078|nr:MULTISPECIES: terminase small subunit [unclassified Acidovorax]MBV7428063.1 terminase small subunit [Acidovorax sp. sif0732]MBV7449320.1 terminase small subunit [Acidovorax sp. sif0715]